MTLTDGPKISPFKSLHSKPIVFEAHFYALEPRFLEKNSFFVNGGLTSRQGVFVVSLSYLIEQLYSLGELTVRKKVERFI